jgi:serine/threonine protein phosphatase PrpC
MQQDPVEKNSPIHAGVDVDNVHREEENTSATGAVHNNMKGEAHVVMMDTNVNQSWNDSFIGGEKSGSLHVYRNKSNEIKSINNAMDHVGLQTCILALKAAFEKIDTEVQRISHWSYQGSTAVAVKLHKTTSLNTTVLISANVGDSRAVLCRDGRAINLTKDHKPNDPDERKRIEGLGGSVEWFGKVDKHGRPIERHTARNGYSGGVYRVNRNLSLSRAIGDRSELPFVCSTVDISFIDLDEEKDRFIILATDGLWDVFESSQEVMDLCQKVMQKATKKTLLQHGLNRTTITGSSSESLERVRSKISKQLVREALRRGSMDNITVIIIWLLQ